MVKIVSSVRKPTFQYYDNLAYLRNGLSNDEIKFQGYVVNHAPPAFVFNSGRAYDFVRSARAKVRKNMAEFLCRLLPRLPKEECNDALDCLFQYYHYKDSLTVGAEKRESMTMLIFDNEKREYVAHVHYSSVSRRIEQSRYTVNATLTCQRFSYFELQETDFDEILEALQNLQVK